MSTHIRHGNPGNNIDMNHVGSEWARRGSEGPGCQPEPSKSRSPSSRVTPRRAIAAAGVTLPCTQHLGKAERGATRLNAPVLSCCAASSDYFVS